MSDDPSYLGRCSPYTKHPWLTGSIALSFLLVGVATVLRPYVTGRLMPGDLGDARFNLTVLEFFYRNLVAFFHGHPTRFLSAPFFYPWPRVTNFSDTFWGDGEVYALARAFGARPLDAFRIWVVGGFVLTYLTSFWSLRALGLERLGAASGAFLFTFPLAMAAQMSHAQLVYRLWVPPALVACDGFLTRASIRAGAACLLFVALQLAASIYIGLFLCLLLVAYSVALLLVRRDDIALPRYGMHRSATRGELETAAAMVVVALIVLAVVGIPYREAQALYGFRPPWGEVAAMLPRPGSYLLAGPSLLWPNLSHVFSYPAVWEHQIFPGLSATVPVAWFIVSRQARRRHPLATGMLAALAILIVVTLDVDGHTLYWLINRIPGFDSVRAVTRIVLVMMMPLAILFGILVDVLVSGATGRVLRRGVAAALCGFMVFECAFITHYASEPSAWHASLARLENRLPTTLPPHAVLAVKTPSPTAFITDWIHSQIDAELAAVMLNASTLNGYSGNKPPTWSATQTCSDIAADIRAGRHFRAEHNLRPADITASRLVLVGFSNDCHPVLLSRDQALELGRTYHFGGNSRGNSFVGGGFSGPETWGRWTDGRNAFLFFSLAATPSGGATITADASSFSPARDRKQTATVFANDVLCGDVVVTTAKPDAEITCPPAALRAGDNMLRLRIAHPTRPSDIGISDDHRRLGLGLESLMIKPKARHS